MSNEGSVIEFKSQVISVNYSEKEEDITGWECRCFKSTTPTGTDTYFTYLKGPNF